MVEQEAEGRRLSGLLSLHPVVGEGQLGDGSRWTLRWGDHDAPGAPAVLAVAAPGAGHALLTIDLARARGDRGLSAAWLSTPASSGPQMIGVLTGAAVDHLDVEPVPARSGPAPAVETPTAERLYRDEAGGRSVFLVRGVPRTDDLTVVGRDRTGATVGRTTVAGTGRDQPPMVAALPEVPAAWGAGFAAVGVAVAAVVLGLVTLGPTTVTARVVCGLIGLSAPALPALRRAVARRQGALPSTARPVHHYLAQGAAMFTLWVGVMWALNPTNPTNPVVGGLLLATLVTVDHRRLARRAHRHDRDTVPESENR